MAVTTRWDPFDRALHVDPYDVWKTLRDHAPVYRNDEYDFYALTRYQDVLDASLDTATYSSAHGITIDTITPEPWPPPAMMIMTDPPQHTPMRKMVNRTFTPRRMNQLTDRVRSLCDGYLDPFVGAGSMDYVTDFSMKLPVMVISSMLGFPEEDHDQLRRWSDAALHRDEGRPEANEHSQQSMANLLAYYADQVAQRRREPRDDMLSDLMATEIVELDGTTRLLDDGEAVAYMALINVAGNETVARLLGWAALTLAEHPEQRALLVEDPSLTPNAVDELLRYDAPSPVQGRWTTRAVMVHGVEIPAGSKVALVTGSAGRDERHYRDPDRFDVLRPNLHHVSFGHGAHYCLGAALARLEGRIALEETLARFPDWHAERDMVEWVHTSTVRGPASVPITY